VLLVQKEKGMSLFLLGMFIGIFLGFAASAFGYWLGGKAGETGPLPR
jgi:hypothetical protein